MIKITNVQEQALKYLAQYKFLTISQFVNLIKMSKNYIRNEITPYKEKGFLDYIRYGLSPKQGTYENLYFLTAKGAKFIAQNLDIDFESIKYPIGEVTIKNDFFHRFSTINTIISLNQFLENKSGQLLQCLTYFDKSGSQRNGTMTVATRLEYGDKQHINPDVLISYTLQEKQFLYIIEVYNGKDTKRIVQQTGKVLQAIYEGATAQKLHLEKTSRLLLVFENESILKTSMHRLKTELSEFDDPNSIIFAKTSENIKNDFSDNWIDLDGSLVNI